MIRSRHRAGRGAARRRAAAFTIALATAGLACSAAADPVLRWTAPTRDAMVVLAAQRARRGGIEGLAGVAILGALAEQATLGLAPRLLRDVGAGAGDVAEQARWVAAEIDRAAPAPGLVRELAIVGPFVDTEGRVQDRRRDIDEGAASSWSRAAKYDWGSEQVRWRDVPFPVDARGAPLGILISPRRESCAYVASRVTFDAPDVVTVSLASTGAARLLWDAQDLGVSDASLSDARFDRVSARVQVTRGDHLVAAKVCQGPHGDAGRVRIRITGADGHAARFTASRVFESLAKVSPLARAAFDPLETATARALREAQTATGDARVALLVVLTLGMMDDQRSPRSSAIVEAIMSDPSSTPDAIAMAGMASRFAAVQGSALHLALERARAAKDTATMDLAERELVAGRLASGYVDWAVAGLGAEPLAHAADADARALRVVARARTGAEAASRACATELDKIVTERGAGAPIYLLDELARCAHAVDPELELRARAAMERGASGAGGAELVRAWQSHGGAATSGAAFAALYRANDIYEIEQMARMVRETGRTAEHAEFTRRGNELDPNRAVLHHERARALFALVDGSGDGTKAALTAALGKVELARAAELATAPRLLNEEVALRSGRAVVVPRDERGLAKPEDFLARARAHPAVRGQVEGRVLHYARFVTLHATRNITDLVHYAREIVAPPTGDAELVENVGLNGNTFDIVRARVHRKDGSVAFAEEERVDKSGPRIKWPDLKPGDVVEVAVRAHRPAKGGRGDAPLSVIVPLASRTTAPILHAEVVVESPKDHALAVDVLNAQPDRTEETSDEKHKTVRYVWNQLPTFDAEPFAPEVTEIYPTVVASRHANWAEFRAWYKAATLGFSEPDSQIRELAEKLTKGKTTRDEKIRALFDFVADDIRYVNYVSGEAWLPNRPQQLLARRQGDCDDKATLLITLLKVIGVDATLALVQTRMHAYPTMLASKTVAIPFFDHGIAYVPARGAEPALWLDATSPESRLGPLPSMDLRTSAFFISEGDAVMTRAPAGAPADHGFDLRWTIELASDGGAKVEAEDFARGGSAHLIRVGLREKANRASWVEEHLTSQLLPQVAVDADVAVEPDLANGAARVKFRAKSAALARREHGDLVVSLGGHMTWSARFANLPTRALPLVLPYYLAPEQDQQILRIVAPEGMMPGPLPPRTTEDGKDFGRATYEAKIDPKDPRAVVVSISTSMDLDVIPAARYAEYRAWLARVDALAHKDIRFLPRPR